MRNAPGCRALAARCLLSRRQSSQGSSQAPGVRYPGAERGSTVRARTCRRVRRLHVPGVRGRARRGRRRADRRGRHGQLPQLHGRPVRRRRLAPPPVLRLRRPPETRCTVQAHQVSACSMQTYAACVCVCRCAREAPIQRKQGNMLGMLGYLITAARRAGCPTCWALPGHAWPRTPRAPHRWWLRIWRTAACRAARRPWRSRPASTRCCRRSRPSPSASCRRARCGCCPRGAAHARFFTLCGCPMHPASFCQHDQHRVCCHTRAAVEPFHV